MDSTRTTALVRNSERGAALIQVGIAILVLMAMSAFVLDFGVMWLSRVQAQNAADAGALAGAIARAYDETSDTPAPDGVAHDSAVTAATANSVFNEPGGVLVTWDCPAYVDSEAHCVRVDVHRDGQGIANGLATDSNTLPVYFATLFGLNSQQVRATATAWAGAANAAECMKPFAVPDLFPAGNPSGYDPPGYTLDANEGTQLLLKGGPGTQFGPGWFRLLDLVGGGGGGAGGTTGTRAQLRSCIPGVTEVDGSLPNQNGDQASISKAIEDLYNLDPGATYNTTTKKIENSCAESHTCQKYPWGSKDNDPPVPDPGRFYSPRVIAIPVFDPKVYAASGGKTIKIVNVFGFFIVPPLPKGSNKDILGILVSQPGLLTSGGGSVPEEAAFLKVIQLIR